MRFEEDEQSGQQPRIAGARAKVLSPDSGQVEEPLRPSRFIERCGQRS